MNEYSLFHFDRAKNMAASESTIPNCLLFATDNYVSSSREIPHLVWIWQKSWPPLANILVSDWLKFLNYFLTKLQVQNDF